MWVRSQCKKKIVKVNSIYFTNTNSYFTFFGKTANGSAIILGKYKTKEKAFEILEDMAKVIGEFGTDWVIVMPKDAEVN